ncbi:MAG: hypothetical protein EBR82_22580 [Caulobacteraceae bacterium]|nr:hypothetical protein [Caulobacteraceae bacterium]
MEKHSAEYYRGALSVLHEDEVLAQHYRTQLAQAEAARDARMKALGAAELMESIHRDCEPGGLLTFVEQMTVIATPSAPK